MAMGRRPNEKARKIVQSILGVSPTLRDKNYSSDKNLKSVKHEMSQIILVKDSKWLVRNVLRR